MSSDLSWRCYSGTEELRFHEVMAKRSLQASTTGISLAKQALRQKSLTQKAIAHELKIASWSTVSKFFNGKPVDRFYFQSICEALGLEWEEVVQPDSTQPVENPPKSKIVQSASTYETLRSAIEIETTAAREALDPRILERIHRTVVRRKYLPAIQRGLTKNLERLIVITAPAGGGKSTILGDLYDELVQQAEGWVGIILCNQMSVSVPYLSVVSHGILAATWGIPPTQQQSGVKDDYLDTAFGKALCGQSIALTEVATILSNQGDRGVLLIDTLDLILNPGMVTGFNKILRKVTSLGITVVVTCRDYDFQHYLEPISERLPGLSRMIDRQSIPVFSNSEIKQAAIAFVLKQYPGGDDKAHRFAENILTLSADNRSLLSIVENPLLLALLCDLFAKEDQVPSDLTVSKLYRKYWAEKVAFSRADLSAFVPLAVEKEKIALQVAQQLYRASSATTLSESIYRDEIQIEFTELGLKALEALLSEGVFSPLPSGKIHFFHQTLLEYAIAFWLTRTSARDVRGQLIAKLLSESPPSHLLAILRQLLTLIEEEPLFDTLVEQLDLKQIGVFSAIAFAAASRENAQGLIKLLPQVLVLEDIYQKRFQETLEIASYQLTAELWIAMMALLRDGSSVVASNTAKSVSLLLARWWNSQKERLIEALEAVSLRSPSKQRLHMTQEQSQLIGWMMEKCFPKLQGDIDDRLLRQVSTFFPLFGQRTRQQWVSLCSQVNVTVETKQQLLDLMMETPLPKKWKDIDSLVRVIAQVLEADHKRKAMTFENWRDRLFQDYPEGWNTVVARAIGQCIGGDTALLMDVVDQLLCLDTRSPVPKDFGAYYRVLQGALDQGKQSAIVDVVIQINPGQVHPTCLTSFIEFVRMQGDRFTPDDQDRLSTWLTPNLNRFPVRMLRALDILADGSTLARETVAASLQSLKEQDRDFFQVRLLRFQPIEEHPSLLKQSKVGQLEFVKLYRELPQSSLVLQKILEACQSHYKAVAQVASYALIDGTFAQLQVSELLPLLTSRFTALNVNGIKAISAATNGGKDLDDETLDGICEAISGCKNQAVLIPFCVLVSRWVQHHHRVSEILISAVGGILPSVVGTPMLDGGLARYLMRVFKAIAQTESSQIDADVFAGWVRDLLMSIDLIRVQSGESEMIEVLSATSRLNEEMLAAIVSEDCPELMAQGWIHNVVPVVRAIARVGSVKSKLLQQIEGSDWCDLAVKGVIVELRMR